MTAVKVSYLGPEGTYAHQTAKQRFGQDAECVPCASIRGVFESVAAGASEFGIVPIENSSGGWIFPTVDLLVGDTFWQDGVVVREALSIDVKLALLAPKETRAITKVYSHQAALDHCEDWLKQNLPDAKPIPVSSTAAAAQMASRERNGSAAIAAKDVASTYRLEVRQFPVAGDCLNVTQFLMLGIRAEEEAGSRRAAIAFGLADEVGALHLFLGPFYEAGINLSRIISRTVKGKPGEYVFLIEIDSKASDPKVVDAIAEAEKHAIFTRVLGSYPVRETYQS
jgi:chorismate mutase/prephenate dehydratase